MTLAKLASASMRSIFRNKMRSFLTSLGIIIGVCSVIVMVAVGSGSQAQIHKQIAAMGTNLIMVMPPRGPRTANRLTMADIQKLRAESSYISAITGEVRIGGTNVVGGNSYWSTTVYGVEPDYIDDQGLAGEVGRFLHGQGPHEPQQDRRARHARSRPSSSPTRTLSASTSA